MHEDTVVAPGSRWHGDLAQSIETGHTMTNYLTQSINTTVEGLP